MTKKYWERTNYEQMLITGAYDYEVNAIEGLWTDRNPYKDEIKTWPDGDEVWEAIEVALEMKYHGAEGIGKNEW